MSSNLPPGCTDHDIDVAAGYWDCDEEQYSEPIYRREECYCCHREFSQDDQTRRWYLTAEVEENGMRHVRKWWKDHHTLTNTKQGWQCDDCAGDPEYLP